MFAAQCGADALGFVFYAASPRHIEITAAAEVISQLPPFVSTVGLFVDAGVSEVTQTLAAAPIDVLQFHGSESPEYCEQFNRPYIKAIRVEKSMALQQTIEKYSSASGILLDSYHPTEKGGTGQQFDWQLIPAELKSAIILAGGLTPENIETAISNVRPYAVDVSSGVEISKGIKSPERIKAFIQKVNRSNNDSIN